MALLLELLAPLAAAHFSAELAQEQGSVQMQDPCFPCEMLRSAYFPSLAHQVRPTVCCPREVVGLVQPAH